MGWRPDDYYKSSPYEFSCACEGYSNKLDSLMRMHRLGAFVTYSVNGGKDPIERFYPLPSDKQQTKGKVKPDKMVSWEEIKKSHNIV